MQKGIKEALFYRGIYFLVPEGFFDASAFIAMLRHEALPLTIQAVVLREKCTINCDSAYELGVSIAPFFIMDYFDGVENIFVDDASEVYLVQVELLTQQEYNDRLRALVAEYCSGCRRFGELTENDSSLSGHFDEMTLSGICLHRYVSGKSPKVFCYGLRDLERNWKRYDGSKRNADNMLYYLKEDLNLQFAGGDIADEGGVRTLDLHLKKGDFFFTVLTDFVAERIRRHVDENYRIVLHEKVAVDEAAVTALLAPKKIASTRTALKKFGVAFAVLTYDEAQEGRVDRLINEMEEECLIYTVFAEPGKRTCLLLGEADALMKLRYWSPMLKNCGAQAMVCDAAKTARYQITFDFPVDTLDLAPVKEHKSPKPSKKQMKAEEGMILKQDQVKLLFKYIELRLVDAGCDHTSRFTSLWLKEHLEPEQVKAALAEIQNMGGFCDCEVILNCYEDYDLEE